VPTQQPIRRDVRALPKAHLHLHLEAGQRPARVDPDQRPGADRRVAAGDRV